MAKINKIIERSYNAYLNYRQSYKERGYGLDRELTIEEYAEVQRGLSHAGEKHIARKVAQEEQTFSRSEAAAIARRLKELDKYEDVDKEALKELQKKYKRGKDIYSKQLTRDEMIELEQKRLDELQKRNVTPSHNPQASARVAFFQDLLDAGISYKEARYIYSGSRKSTQSNSTRKSENG